MILRVGAIYSLTYTRWKHNRLIYSFILYAAPGNDKVHALNLGCRELGTIGRTKLANIISRLSKVSAAKQWDGATLYRIFRTYLPREIALSYRTYFKAHISQASLINYGFNSPDSFTELDLSQNNKVLFEAAGKDLFIKLLNMYTGRGVQMQAVEDSLATVGVAANTPDNVIETDAAEEAETTVSSTENNVSDEPEIGGYY